MRSSLQVCGAALHFSPPEPSLLFSHSHCRLVRTCRCQEAKGEGDLSTTFSPLFLKQRAGDSLASLGSLVALR